MRPSPRSCARATLAAFFVWWELLGAQPLMPDFLGSVGGAEEQGESTDFLGRQVPLAFKSQPALPAGGGAPGASAAPPSVAGAGTVAGPSAAGAAGTRGAAGGDSSLALLARALGVSEQALKTADWAKKLFGSDQAPPGTAPTPEFRNEIARGEVPPGDFDPQMAAMIRDAFASGAIPNEIFPGEALGEPSAAAGGAGGGAGAGAGPESAAGLVGSALGLAGSVSGNRDVSMAGTTASAAGNLGSLAAYGAGVAGSGAAAAGAIPALLFSGLQMEHDMSDAARIKADIANVKNVLGAKVPSAMSRLGKTLKDISSLDPASATTEQLLGAQQQLQAARAEFNQVDAAFKGALLVGNKPVQTGLTLDMVKPQLDALNESQLRIQDALESRGIQSGQIPGYQDPLSWLNFLDAPLFQRYGAGATQGEPGEYGSVPLPDLPNPEFQAALKAIQPGQTEAGLRALIARGLPARVPRPAPESLIPRALGSEDFSGAASAMDAP